MFKIDDEVKIIGGHYSDGRDWRGAIGNIGIITVKAEDDEDNFDWGVCIEEDCCSYLFSEDELELVKPLSQEQVAKHPKCSVPFNKHHSGIKEEPGEQREFSTGAKKQDAEGKGTPVLLPPDAMLEIAKHFEGGMRIYGARNWEKGINLSEILNSLLRHIFQEMLGLTDERHDRAIAWNAIVYLAIKLRIKGGVLPAELDDIPYQNYKREEKVAGKTSDTYIEQIGNNV